MKQAYVFFGHVVANSVLGVIDRSKRLLAYVHIIVVLLACIVFSVNAYLLIADARIVLNIVPASPTAYSYAAWYTREYSQLSPTGAISGVRLIAACDIERRETGLICRETGNAPSEVQLGIFQDYTLWYACNAHSDRLACVEYSNQ